MPSLQLSQCPELLKLQQLLTSRPVALRARDVVRRSSFRPRAQTCAIPSGPAILSRRGDPKGWGVVKSSGQQEA